MKSNLDLKTFSSQLRTTDWRRELLSDFQERQDCGLESKDCRLLIINARREIEQGRARVAVNWLNLGLFLDAGHTLKEIRRSGLLRASTRQYRAKPISTIVDCLIEQNADGMAPDHAIDYLRSVSSLLNICPNAHRIYLDIARVLRAKSQVAPKTLVAIVELMFMQYRLPDLGAGPDAIEYYPIEQHAEALSYLLHLFGEIIGFQDLHSLFVDEKGIADGTYRRILVNACKLIVYRETEIWLDTFDYSACVDGKFVVVSPRDTALEKSIRFGYVSTFLQSRIAADRTRADGVDRYPSLDAFAQEVYAVAGERIAQLVEHPVRRYVFILPKTEEFYALFKGENLFLEDAMSLKSAASKDLTYALPPDLLLQHRLGEHLTLRDILKIQRLLDLIRKLVDATLRPLVDSDLQVVLNSIVPVFERADLETLLSRCVDERAAKSFIALIDYWSGDKRDVFDIQYRPMVRTGNAYMLPLNIFCGSDLVRNLLYAHKKKGDTDDRDCLTLALAGILKQKSSRVEVNKKFKANGISIEIDVVALVGPYLLLGECKSPFHPCGAHELRTSFEHIKRARDQLDKMKGLLTDPGAVGKLLHELGWPLPQNLEILTCIVLGNRLFSGYRIGSHPVRNGYEMVNFIDSGLVEEVIISGSPKVANETTRCYSRWAGDEFGPSDLLRYLQDDSIYTHAFAAMVEVTLSYPFGSRRLMISTFALDPECLSDLMCENHPVSTERELSGSPE